MNKKTMLVILILSISLIAAGATPTRLMRLTVNNASERSIEIKMTGKYLEKFYYLRIPEGVKNFTVIPDVYSTTLYFVELWDPVYGYHCSSMSQSLDLTRNVNLKVLPCDERPPNGGDTGIVKYGGGGRRGR
jgi:hypothetical protein